jgi:hypothetical protein
MTRTRKPFYKNTLVAYKGGGYDGCWWEWNYCYIDKDGQFRDIFSSGYRGIHSLEELWTAYNEDPEDFICYYLRYKSHREQMGRKEPVARLILIARWLVDNKIGTPDLMVKCDYCGDIFDLLAVCGEPDLAQDYTQESGLVVAPHKIVCPRCLEEGYCATCGDWEDPNTLDENGECEWCAETTANTCQRCGEEVGKDHLNEAGYCEACASLICPPDRVGQLQMDLGV